MIASACDIDREQSSDAGRRCTRDVTRPAPLQADNEGNPPGRLGATWEGAHLLGSVAQTGRESFHANAIFQTFVLPQTPSDWL